MRFIFDQADADLIAKLEEEHDPYVVWANSPAWKHFTGLEREAICRREKARVARGLRWAILFRDLPAFDREAGAADHNPLVFEEAFMDLAEYGCMKQEAKEEDNAFVVRCMTTLRDIEEDCDQLVCGPSPATVAVRTVFLEREIEEMSGPEKSGAVGG